MVDGTNATLHHGKSAADMDDETFAAMLRTEISGTGNERYTGHDLKGSLDSLLGESPASISFPTSALGLYGDEKHRRGDWKE